MKLVVNMCQCISLAVDFIQCCCKLAVVIYYHEDGKPICVKYKDFILESEVTLLLSYMIQIQ